MSSISSARSRHSHLRLAVAVLVGVAAGVLFGEDIATRALIGWDIAAAVWLVAATVTMARTEPSQLKKIASEQDETASLILVILVCAVAASLGGVIAEIGAAANSAHPSLFTLLGVVTLILSWLFMHTLFAMHYAHRFCGGRGRSRSDTPDAGVAFPGSGKDPGYFDFIYVAFCIGMTCQVSDVDVLTLDFRRLVTVHAVLSFFYNMFILGLAVNLFASLRAF